MTEPLSYGGGTTQTRPVIVTASTPLPVVTGPGGATVFFAEDGDHTSGDYGSVMLGIADSGASGTARTTTLKYGVPWLTVRGALNVVLRAVDGTDLSAAATPAGTNLIGRVAASNETSGIYNGTTALVPLFAAISGTTSGDNTLVAADATKKIRVLSMNVIAAAAVAFRLESAAGGTALTGVQSLSANGGFVLPFSPIGHFETAANQLLNMELGGAVQVSGSLVYVLV